MSCVAGPVTAPAAAPSVAPAAAPGQEPGPAGGRSGTAPAAARTPCGAAPMDAAGGRPPRRSSSSPLSPLFTHVENCPELSRGKCAKQSVMLGGAHSPRLGSAGAALPARTRRQRYLAGRPTPGSRSAAPPSPAGDTPVTPSLAGTSGLSSGLRNHAVLPPTPSYVHPASATP